MPRILRSFAVLLAAVLSLPALVNAAVGYTPGSFNVSPTGAATYSIPIAVPPGAAGMQPSLSLAYSSQGGNGLVGMGFSLQGLSAITRCPKTYATDGTSGGVDLTYNDRYCLDGQRLILVSGTYGYANSEYRTELDTLTRVIAYGTAGNGPAYFTAQTKSGQIIQYGNTADSRIIATGKTTAAVWNANRITDTVGNYMTVTYTQNTSTGEYYPQRIDYAGNAGTPTSSSVQFVYATRTDTFTGYVGGSKITNTQRLTNVGVFEGWNSIRDYRLTYEYGAATARSRLTDVTECDSNLGGANCLPATTVTWTDSASTFNSPSLVLPNTVAPAGNTYATSDYQYIADFNGDGKADYMWNNNGWYVALSNGNGFDAPTLWLSNTGAPNGRTYNPGYQYIADLNGDGKADYLWNYNGWYVALSNGHGFNAPTLWLSNTGSPGGHTYNPGYQYVADFNGDGKADYLWNYNGWYVALSTGNGFASPTLWLPSTVASLGNTYSNANYQYIADFNGDGKADYLWNYNGWYVALSNGHGFDAPTQWLSNTGSPGGHTYNPGYQYVADFNGDGKADYLWNYNGWYVALSTGNGFTSPTLWLPSTIASLGNTYANSDYQYIADFNGDGKADYLWNYYGWYVALSNGNGFDSPKLWLSNTGAPNGRTYNPGFQYFGDFNGDGKIDYFWNYYGWYLASGTSPFPDQVGSIKNGLGLTTSITYKPLTDNSVYTKGTGAAFPRQDFQGALYVVSQYTTSDGVGGNYPVTYTYSGARIDVQGRGFLGFSQTIATDTRTHIATEVNYSQDWPTTGLVSSVTKRYNGAIISSTVNSLNGQGLLAFTGADATKYYFPYISQSVESRYELGGGSVPYTTVTTLNYLDSYCWAGNDWGCELRQIIIHTSDGNSDFTKTTTNTYDYTGVASWILGRLTNAKVTSTLPSGATKTRESAFTYYPTTGLLWTEVVEPNQNVGGVTNMTQTTTYTYDGFGNKTGATVSGADGIARPATASDNASTAGAPYAYNAGRFETNLTNAANQGETRVYDARFGTVASLTGPNGLSTTWTYDSFGRKQQELRADNTKTIWAAPVLCTTGCPPYAKYSITQTTDGAPTVTVYYDLLDREVRTQTVGYNGTSIYKDTVYNTLGQVAKVSRPYYNGDTPWWTYYSYDALGRVTSQSLPTQASTAGTLLGTTSYNGLVTTATQYRDGTALTTTQTKDALGELAAVTDANGQTTTYQYDPFGNLTQVRDPLGNLTTMSYDIRGRKLTMTDPDMGYWQYFYDSVGDLTKQIDAKGQQVTMAYNDPLGRMTARTEAEGTTTWVYDSTTLSGARAKGKLSQVNWPGGSRTYGYDDKGRPSTETTTLLGASYTITTTYDLYSRIDTRTYPGGFAVRNNYNAYGYLNIITNAATGFAYWNLPQYTAAGEVAAFTLGNNLMTVNRYNLGTGLLEGISTGVGGGSATQYLTYQYDTLGSLKQRVDGNQANLTENFGYDNLNRMTSAAVAGGASKSVSYDALGNITTKSDVGGTWTYDPVHVHAVKTTALGSYTYDANGNQLTGPNRLVHYTSYNQPLDITQSGKTNSFVYDGEHLRVSENTSEGTTIILHPRMDQGVHYEEVHKTNGTVEQKNFIYAGKEFIAVYTQRSSGANDTRYYHKDHLGSVDTITNESGGIVERDSYDAWGKRRNGNWSDATSPITSLTRHGFTGHEMLDDVGLINMNGRVYDPTLGRFIQADPTMQSPGNPQVLNRYSYANNNPLTYTDPSGYGWLSKWWRPILAIAIAVFVPEMSWYFGHLANFVAGFAGGLIASGGDLKAGVIGGLTAGTLGVIHGMPSGPWSTNLVDDVSKVVAHGLTGGVSSVLQGQKFKSGFMAGGFTQAASLSGAFDRLGGGSDTAVRTKNAVASAVVGGTASVIGGGKFENGAVTGAFSRLFNDLYIVKYNGAGVFGHIGSGVVGKNTVGLYPDGEIPLGQSQDGSVQYDVRENNKTPQDIIIIRTTPEQDRAYQNYLDNAQGHPPSYDLNANSAQNCATFVENGLRSIGINAPTAITPQGFMDGLRKMYP